MGLSLETAIAWMQARKGQVSYSMDDRNGPDSYDCSSSIYYALTSAGAVSAGWAVNTEYEHDWLKKNGYELIAENTPWDAQRGDVFIWGRRGYSSGAGGHTGIFVDSDNIIHCNYRFNGITVNDHDDIWIYAGRPYYYVYRLTNPNAQPAKPKKAGSRTIKAIGTLEQMGHIRKVTSSISRKTNHGSTSMPKDIARNPIGFCILMGNGTTLKKMDTW